VLKNDDLVRESSCSPCAGTIHTSNTPRYFEPNTRKPTCSTHTRTALSPSRRTRLVQTPLNVIAIRQQIFTPSLEVFQSVSFAADDAPRDAPEPDSQFQKTTCTILPPPWRKFAGNTNRPASCTTS
jgi:hypothetical protein